MIWTQKHQYHVCLSMIYRLQGIHCQLQCNVKPSIGSTGEYRICGVYEISDGFRRQYHVQKGNQRSFLSLIYRLSSVSRLHSLDDFHLSSSIRLNITASSDGLKYRSFRVIISLVVKALCLRPTPSDSQ